MWLALKGDVVLFLSHEGLMPVKLGDLMTEGLMCFPDENL